MNQKEILKIKNTVVDMKNDFDRLICRLDVAEERMTSDVNSPQFDLLIQHNPNKNPSKPSHRHQQADSNIYAERQKTSKSQHSTEAPQSRRTDATQVQHSL